MKQDENHQERKEFATNRDRLLAKINELSQGVQHDCNRDVAVEACMNYSMTAINTLVNAIFMEVLTDNKDVFKTVYADLEKGVLNDKIGTLQVISAGHHLSKHGATIQAIVLLWEFSQHAFLGHIKSEKEIAHNQMLSGKISKTIDLLYAMMHQCYKRILVTLQDIRTSGKYSETVEEAIVEFIFEQKHLKR